MSESGQSTDETAHVGPIIFGHPVARRQLTERNAVVTFRETERTVGETWWRESRTGPKKGDCRVLFRGGADPSNDERLKPFVHLSGFDSLEDWRQAIADVNGELPDSGYLYRVETPKNYVPRSEQRTLRDMDTSTERSGGGR